MKRTALITGGTGGIGRAVAASLVKLGYKVILHGTNKEKGNAVLASLPKSAEGEAHFVVGDLSSLDGIRKFAADVKKLTDKIDVLIHSTGTLNSERKETKDGYEAGFVINYLNRFILDQLLLDALKKGEGKIIVVGAPVLKKAKINFDDIHLKKNYSLFGMLGQAQLSVHLHVQEFAKRNGQHPVINVIHPGVVKTGIDRNLKGFIKITFGIFGPLLRNSVEKGVANVVALATTNDSSISGYFFPKPGKFEVREKLAYDAALAERLWKESLVWGKL